MGSRKHGGSIRRSRPSSSPLSGEEVGDVRDRSRFTVDKLILGDHDERQEFYIQIILSRKAAGSLLVLLTLCATLVEAGTRVLLP
jgi:hypothetical protein